MNKKKVTAITVGLLFVLGAISATQWLENVNSDEIVVCQTITGEMYVHTEAGPSWQGFGYCRHYPREFEARFLENEALPIRFNDQGKAQIAGVARVKMPLDEKSILAIHRAFGSYEAVETELVERTINRSVYNAGPMMSSKESASDRRTDLLEIIEDQVKNGIIKTKPVAVEKKDPLTGEVKTVKVAKIELDENGQPVRVADSPLKEFNVTVYGLDIKHTLYDANVQRQIDAQRDAQMTIQTAIAEAKKAEQDRITVEEQGKAAAMKAKWEQEKINATEIAQAEKEKAVAELNAQRELEVAKLAKLAAIETKQKEIYLGQGEAERKRLVMHADGALKQKLDAWVKSNELWADAYAKRAVPTTVFGASTGDVGSNTDVQTFMQLQNVKAMRDLNLNTSVPKGSQ